VVGGILLGGVIAEKFSRHMEIVTIAHMAIVASVILPAVVMAPGAALVVMLVITGIGMGAVLTPRDLMIRGFTPPGESGKVFGFIFVGYSIGGGVVPVLFGWFLDHDQAAMIFVMAALFALGSLAAVAMARWVMPKR
jgi:MFS family permease